jgi:DNA-binding MarR family transcriptional regulator
MSAGSADDLRHHVEEIDKLIHEPARLLLMVHLYVVDEADFVYLLDRTGLTAGNVSSHMKKLVDADYVEMEKDFVANRPQTTYRLSNGGRTAFDAYRDNIAEILRMLPEEER